MSDLLSSISYNPDADGDALAVGLDVHLAGATKLVVNWGDGTYDEVLTVSPGTTIEHVSHKYGGPVDGHIVVRAAVPGQTDDRETLPLQVQDGPSQYRDLPQEITDPVISSSGRYAVWNTGFEDLQTGKVVNFPGYDVDPYRNYPFGPQGPFFTFTDITQNEEVVYYNYYNNDMVDGNIKNGVVYDTSTESPIAVFSGSIVEVTSDSKFAIYVEDSTSADYHYHVVDLINGEYFDDDIGSNPSNINEMINDRYLVSEPGNSGAFSIEDTLLGTTSSAGPSGAGNSSADGRYTVTFHDHRYVVSDNDLIPNTINGTAGNDVLLSGPSDGTINGNAGKDYLSGGAGDDVLSGGDGNDTLNGGTGADQIDGGAGTDTATYSTARAAVTVDLTNNSLNTGDAAGDQYVSIEAVTGSKFADHLSGSNQADQLRGLGGNDVLTGRAGDDRLVGGDGNDILDGGPGHDILYGGKGADTFVFTSFNIADTDTIADFEVAKDLIQLDHTIFTHLVADAVPAFAIGTAATSPIDFLFYNSGTGNLYYDVDGSKTAHAPYLVANLATGLHLTASNFSVV